MAPRVARPLAASTIGRLLGRSIVEADGTRLGHVADIQLSERPPYRVTALLCGRRGLLHRLHVLNLFTERHTHPHKPDRIPWEQIERIEERRIVLKKREDG